MLIESLILGNSNQGSNSDGAFTGYMSGISNASTPNSSDGVDARCPDLDMPRNEDNQALRGRAQGRYYEKSSGGRKIAVPPSPQSSI